jgi:hypothetical protein
MKNQDIVAFATLTLLLGSYVMEPRHDRYYKMNTLHTHNELPIPEQLAENAGVANSTLPPHTFLDIGSLVDFLPLFEDRKPGEL